MLLSIERENVIEYLVNDMNEDKEYQEVKLEKDLKVTHYWDGN